MFFSHLRCEWFIFIDFPDRDITADAVRLGLLALTLAIVEIHVPVRGHDDIVAESGGLDSPFSTPPGHHDSVNGSVALKNLVPADKPSSVLLQKLAYTLSDIALEQLLGGVVLISL